MKRRNKKNEEESEEERMVYNTNSVKLYVKINFELMYSENEKKKIFFNMEMG